MEWIDMDVEFGILGVFIVSLVLQYLDRKIDDIKKENNIDDDTEYPITSKREGDIL